VDELRLDQGWNDFQSFVDSLDDALVIIGAGYRIVQVNAAAMRSTGRSGSELIGQTCYAVLHNRSAPCGILDGGCPVSQVWQTGRPARVMHHHFDSTGNLHVTEVTATLLPGPERPPRVAELLHDVTVQINTAQENERLLEQTRRARDELDAIFNTIPDAINIIGADYRVVKANLGARSSMACSWNKSSASLASRYFTISRRHAKSAWWCRPLARANPASARTRACVRMDPRL